MIKMTLSRSIVLAGVLAAAGAVQAQSATETSNTPQRAGEASTMTKGVPNAKTSNDSAATTTKKTSKDKMAKAGGSSANKGSATETSNVPQRAGEASTMTGGVPNKKTTN
jgi:cytoskeletal protein RodZ